MNDFVNAVCDFAIVVVLVGTVVCIALGLAEVGSWAWRRLHGR